MDINTFEEVLDVIMCALDHYARDLADGWDDDPTDAKWYKRRIDICNSIINGEIDLSGTQYEGDSNGTRL